MEDSPARPPPPGHDRAPSHPPDVSDASAPGIASNIGAAPTRYVGILLGTVLGGLALVATLNRAVDPYRLFSSDRSAVHAGYPALHANMRLHKVHQVNLQKPDAVVLGTSKAVQGIPLDHPRFAGRRVYNLAMPLATMEENARLLRHALANAELRDVVLAVDFLSFNVRARTDGPAAGFVASRLKGAPDGEAKVAADYLAALLSLDALRASLAVLAGAEGGDHRVLTGLGGREDAEIRSRLADGGHRSNSRRIEAFFTDSVYLPAPHREFAFEADGADAFAWFEDFLRTAHAHDVPTTLLIGPSHARLWELIRVAGLGSALGDWKRRLVASNERVARELGRAPFALWDFTLPGPVTTEPFPEAGDADARMAGYYESVHFNQDTGARVLDEITEAERAAREADAETGDPTPASGRDADAFGVKLTGGNVEDVLRLAREGQAAFRRANPDQIRELEAIVAESLPARP